MIPSYSVPLLDRNITELQKEHFALKNLIEQGDMKAVQSLASLKQKVCHLVFRPNKCSTELNFIFHLKVKVSAISTSFLCQLFFSLSSMGIKMFQKLTKNQ